MQDITSKAQEARAVLLWRRGHCHSAFMLLFWPHFCCRPCHRNTIRQWLVHLLNCSWLDGQKKTFWVASKAAVALAELPSKELPTKGRANIITSLRCAGIYGAYP